MTLSWKRERAHRGHTGVQQGEKPSAVALGTEMAEAKEIGACEMRGTRCRRTHARGRESDSHRPDAHEG